MESKNKLKSLTIQGAGVLTLLEFMPEIITEINVLVPGDISAHPLVVRLLTIAGIVTVVVGRLRAKTKLV